MTRPFASIMSLFEVDNGAVGMVGARMNASREGIDRSKSASENHLLTFAGWRSIREYGLAMNTTRRGRPSQKEVSRAAARRDLAGSKNRSPALQKPTQFISA